MGLRKVAKGEEFHPSAELHNATVDAIEFARRFAGGAASVQLRSVAAPHAGAWRRIAACRLPSDRQAIAAPRAALPSCASS